VSADWVTFAFEAANFLLLMALLAWLFFRPLRASLERRRLELASEQSAAAAARGQAEREREQLALDRSAQEAEWVTTRERLRGEAEGEREALLEASRAQMMRERERLDQELQAARRAQTHALARDAAFAGHAIVLRLLAELKGPELEEMLLAAACRNLEQLRGGGSLAPIVIESAGRSTRRCRLASRLRPIGRDAVQTRVDQAGRRAASLTARSLVAPPWRDLGADGATARAAHRRRQPP
jgi:F0F1-type ATP synthase membrane subunit b/b'